MLHKPKTLQLSVKTIFIYIYSAVFLVLVYSRGNAQEQRPGEGFVAPGKHPESRYLEVWRNSPFELEAAPEKAVAQTAEKPSNDYFLAGVMKRGGEYIAYIQNRKTGSVTKATSGTVDGSGFVLKSVTPGGNPGEYVAEVEYQGKTLTLGYDRSTKAKPASISKTGTAAASTVKRDSSKAADFNPAKLALEKARKEAKARALAANRGKSKGEAPHNRKRKILIPR